MFFLKIQGAPLKSQGTPMLNSHRVRHIFISWIQDNMHPDKVPLSFGIKISPHHHSPIHHA